MRDKLKKHSRNIQRDRLGVRRMREIHDFIFESEIEFEYKYIMIKMLMEIVDCQKFQDVPDQENNRLAMFKEFQVMNIFSNPRKTKSNLIRLSDFIDNNKDREIII